MRLSHHNQLHSVDTSVSFLRQTLISAVLGFCVLSNRIVSTDSTPVGWNIHQYFVSGNMYASALYTAHLIWVHNSSIAVLSNITVRVHDIPSQP